MSDSTFNKGSAAEQSAVEKLIQQKVQKQYYKVPKFKVSTISSGQPLQYPTTPPATQPEKEDSVKSLSKEKWDSLPEKGQWDIKVALRGPDSYYGETLKWYTTSVIRGHVREVFRVGGTVNKDLNLVILPNGMGSNSPSSKYAWNHSHFTEHIQSAAEWLHIPILYIENPLWHEAMSYHSISGGGQLVLKQQIEMKESLKEELERHLKYVTMKGMF